MKKTRISKIKSARSLRDLSAILKEINAELDDLDGNVTDLNISVSNVKITGVDDVEFDPSQREEPTRKKGGGLPSHISGFKKPDIKALVNNSKTLEKFAQDIAELEALRNTLLSEQFSALPNTDKLRREAEKSIKEAKRSRDKQLKSMKLAVSAKPSEVKNFVGTVNKHLLKIIPEEDYSEIKQHSFVLLPEGRKDKLWYQTYVTIRDFAVGTDFIFDRYTFVITIEVDLEDGAITRFVTTLKSDAVPGSFSPGTEVKSSAKAKQVINTYLAADDFEADHGNRLKLSPDYDKDKNIKKNNYGVTTTALRHRPVSDRSSFTLSDFDIAKVRIQNDKIYFRFEAGVDEHEVEENKDKIFVALKTFLGSVVTRRSTVVSNIVRRQGRLYLVVSLIPPKSKGQKLMSDVDRFATSFGLDKASKAKLKRFIIDG